MLQLKTFHVITHIVSTETYNRLILGRLVARYWAVFVFDLRNPIPFHVIEHIFSTGTYNRQILGRLVARHWAVFVFDLRKSQEEISPSCTSTHSWYRNIFLWV